MDLALVLTANFPHSEWTLNGEKYSGLTWLSQTPKPTEEELENLWPSVAAQLENQNQEKIDAKVSALAKLEALGLTVTEVEAAFGLTK
jgi:hypothetical protein